MMPALWACVCGSALRWGLRYVATPSGITQCQQCLGIRATGIDWQALRGGIATQR